MRFERFSGIPLMSLLYAGFGITAVLLIALLGMHPLQASIRQLDEEIALLRARLEQQKELAPLQREFNALLTQHAADRLPAPERSGLSLEQVVEIRLLFQKLADQCGLDTISAVPEVKSFTRDRKFMPTNLILKGSFLKFRKFLFDIESLPCLEHIEELQIQEIGGAQEFRLKVWLAVNPQKSS